MERDHSSRLRALSSLIGNTPLLVIDPFIQSGKFTASDGAASDYFGYSVAVSGAAFHPARGSLGLDLTGNAAESWSPAFGGTWTTTPPTALTTGRALSRFC